MADKLNLRARFPDGKTETMRGLPSSITYTALLEQLRVLANLDALPQRVLVAGPPPHPIEVDSSAPLSTFLKTGDSLIVEPIGRTETAGPGRSRGRKPKKTMVEKAEAKLKSAQGTSGSKRKARVATLDTLAKSKGRRRKTSEILVDEDVDDPRDKDWEEGATDEDGADEVQAERRKRPKRKRRQAATGEGLGQGGFDPLGLGAAAEGIGFALADSLRKDDGKLDVTGKKFREGLQSALKERMIETAGERRYAAWLGGKYRFTEVASGAAFTVEVKELDAEEWMKDMDGAMVIVYEREVLSAAFEDVLKGTNAEEDRERLRPSEMAKVSPRIFWNMVRLFADDLHKGLRELVPQGEWGFLDGRRKFLSEKAKRNIENKATMRWESDS